MTTSSKEDCYPICRKCCGTGWNDIAPVIEDEETLAILADKMHLPFLPDLAKLERGMKRVAATHLPETVDERSVNPTLLLLNLSWKNLSALAEGNVAPERGDERLLLWKDRSSGVKVEPATDERLLALKVVLEELDTATVAREGGATTIVVEKLLRQAAAETLLLLPPSKIRRSGPDFNPVKWPDEVLAVRTFCLQWHLTNRCDLSCRHCYDRTDRGTIPADRSLGILHELNDFCRSRNVSGHVSFTGGNPFLHPEFVEIYRQAAQLGLSAAILGNPVSREKLQEITAIAPPSYFQVSLEGLREHNDAIRGEGNFDAVLAFLDLLKELGIYSVVMLTLTRNNLREVLPLAEYLENRASAFTFNRLASFGAGKSLEPAEPAEYRSFLEKYLSTWKKSSILGRKDNLLNLIHREQNEKLFDGCTGFGCGAAFSFLSLLPDGEVHACRKFPSPIGNVFTNSLEDIYESPLAAKYRAGSAGCAGCDIRAVCGGCPAVTAGAGRDPFNDRDPYCFHPAKNHAYT